MEDIVVSRRRLLLLAGQGSLALSAGSVLAACGGASKVPAGAATTAASGYVKGGGLAIPELKWILPNDPASMDYTQVVDIGSSEVVTSLTDVLFAYDPSNRFVPFLATSYDYRGDSALVLKIRDGVTFHDGSPLTAEDVAYSLNRVRDKRTASYFAVYCAYVDTIRATASHEVTITFRQPDFSFVQALGCFTGGVTSKAFVERHGGKVGTPSVGAMGTGPYRFVSWTKGQDVVLERYADHWNDGLPCKVERVTASPVPDVNSEITALKAGAFDGISNASMTGRDTAALDRAPGLYAATTPTAGTLYVGMNVARGPFRDLRVRQAVAHAVDRKGMVEGLFAGYASLPKTISPPSSWSYGRAALQASYDALPAIDHDPEKARSLVKQAGAAGAHVLLIALQGYYPDVTQAVVQALQDIGLNVTVRSLDAASFGSYNKPNAPADAIVVANYADFPDPFSLYETMCAPGAAYNFMNFSDPTVTAILAHQRAVRDVDARTQQLIRVQSIVAQQIPAVPLLTPSLGRVFSDKIGGFVPGPGLYYPWIPQLSGRSSG